MNFAPRKSKTSTVITITVLRLNNWWFFMLESDDHFWKQAHLGQCTLGCYIIGLYGQKPIKLFTTQFNPDF